MLPVGDLIQSVLSAMGRASTFGLSSLWWGGPPHSLYLICTVEDRLITTNVSVLWAIF